MKGFITLTKNLHWTGLYRDVFFFCARNIQQYFCIISVIMDSIWNLVLLTSGSQNLKEYTLCSIHKHLLEIRMHRAEIENSSSRETRVEKHWYRIQINQPTICNNFSSLLLDVYVQLHMFRASSRPSSCTWWAVHKRQVINLRSCCI
jgi:hypothetical protein